MKTTVLVLLIYYLYFRQSLLERLLDCFVDSVEGAPSDKVLLFTVHMLEINCSLPNSYSRKIVSTFAHCMCILTELRFVAQVVEHWGGRALGW
jgi:hypothetical protein